MPDIGILGISIAGYPQYLVLQKLFLEVQLDTIAKGREIKFRKEIIITEGII
jgi:hypothetical protein